MQYHFPRRLKLKEAAQFSRVFNQAHKVSTNKFAIFYCANDLATPRLGIVAAKKNIHDAHQRNTFKRVVRESFRLKQHHLKNCDFIVFAYKLATTTTNKELYQCLNQQWDKLVNSEKKQLL